uniref:Uncharacterized protein n=1 Tax=viral metagenome TaxID=1070528 RepID=A0A6C0EI24_9ZZZZ
MEGFFSNNITMEIPKQLLYIIIGIKVLFIIMFLYYKFAYYNNDGEEKLEEIEEKKEILHASFVFFTYLLLVLLLNPYNKNIILHANRIDSYHFQVVIFTLGIIQLVNFDYNILFQIPETLF